MAEGVSSKAVVSKFVATKERHTPSGRRVRTKSSKDWYRDLETAIRAFLQRSDLLTDHVDAALRGRPQQQLEILLAQAQKAKKHVGGTIEKLSKALGQSADTPVEARLT